MYLVESEETSALRTNIRRYPGRECPPKKLERWDREDFIPREELHKRGDPGISVACIPGEYGGIGDNVSMMVTAVEELARCRESRRQRWQP